MGVKTFNVSLPAELVEIIDIQAKLSYATRSEYLKQALVARLVKEGVFSEAFRAKDQKKLLGGLKQAQLKRFLAGHRKAYPPTELEDLS